MPAPRKFSPEQLRDAALAIVDEEGLAALTMRALAGRLGTGAMTIYNYVDGREGLEALVTEAVLAQAPTPGPERPDWRDDVRALATTLWQAIRAHPNAIPLVLTRRTLDRPTLHQAEAMLRALRRGGHSGFDLLAAFRAVSGFVAGFAQAELVSPAEAIGRVRELAPDDFAGLREMAAAAADTDPAAEFTAALNIVVAGLG